MTAKELEKLVNSLRSNGVTYFKTHDLEVKLEPTWQQAQTVLAEKPLTPTNSPDQAPVSDVNSTHFESAPEGTENAGNVPHKVQELASLMKLSDRDLLDRLFPELPKEEEQ